MRLHSEYPYWMISEGIERSYPTLREDVRADVAVIGAGMRWWDMHCVKRVWTTGSWDWKLGHPLVKGKLGGKAGTPESWDT